MHVQKILISLFNKVNTRMHARKKIHGRLLREAVVTEGHVSGNMITNIS